MPHAHVRVYEFSIAKKGSPDDTIPLDDLPGGRSFIEIVHEIFSAYLGEDLQVNEDSKTGYQLSRLELDEEGLSVTGEVVVGNFGYAADGINRHSKTRSYQRTTEDVEIVPTLFQFYVQPDSVKGILFLFTFNLKSPYTVIRTRLLRALTSHPSTSKLRLRIERKAERTEVEALIAAIESIEFITFGTSASLSDSLRPVDPEEKGFSVAVSINPKRNKRGLVRRAFPAIVQAIRTFATNIGNREDSRREIQRITGFDPDVIRVEAEIDGHIVKRDLEKPFVWTGEDVTNEVCNDAGQIDFDLVKQYLMENRGDAV